MIYSDKNCNFGNGSLSNNLHKVYRGKLYINNGKAYYCIGDVRINIGTEIDGNKCNGVFNTSWNC